MNIALDYDRTFTEDPYLWDFFVGMCLHRGHAVYIVTARHKHEVLELETPRGVPVIFTGRKMKERHCLDEHGIKIDVWIDDMPGMIQECVILKTATDEEL